MQLMTCFYVLFSDDRAVRDSERKAALVHFGTDQANQLTEHPAKSQTPERKPNPRAKYVSSLARNPAGKEDDCRM